MRFINNSRINFPDNWEKNAQTATKALLKAEIVPDDRNYIWKQLKDELADISNDRCWYCETSIIRSDNAVDHFRPKGKIQGVMLNKAGGALDKFNIQPDHHGYKWLAFESDNFRFSCQHCNEYRKDLKGTCGGKWNYFPLMAENQRGYNVGDEEDEDPALLDPCNAIDWELLSYNRNGMPFSRFDEDTEEDIKVKYSIRVYHLDSTRLNEGRAAQWHLFKPRLDDAKKNFIKKLNKKAGANMAFNQSLKAILQQLDSQNKSIYLGFLLYQLEVEKENDQESIHVWISKILKTAK